MRVPAQIFAMAIMSVAAAFDASAQACQHGVLDALQKLRAREIVAGKMSRWLADVCSSFPAGHCCVERHGCYSYTLSERLQCYEERQFPVANGFATTVRFGDVVHIDAIGEITADVVLTTHGQPIFFSDGVATLHRSAMQALYQRIGPFVHTFSELGAWYTVSALLDGEQSCLRFEPRPSRTWLSPKFTVCSQTGQKPDVLWIEDASWRDPVLPWSAAVPAVLAFLNAKYPELRFANQDSIIAGNSVWQIGEHYLGHPYARAARGTDTHADVLYGFLLVAFEGNNARRVLVKFNSRTGELHAMLDDSASPESVTRMLGSD